MQAVVMYETRSPDILRYEEIDRPEPGDSEVLIKVHAASVNPTDWKLRRGFMSKPLPTVLGYDVSGTVETARADGFAEGDEVFGSSASSGCAKLYSGTPSAGMIAKKPEGVSHEQAAAIPVAGLTAWQALFETGAGVKRAVGSRGGCRRRCRPFRRAVRQGGRRAGDGRDHAQPRLRAGPGRQRVRGLHAAGRGRGGERRPRRVRHRRRRHARLVAPGRARGRNARPLYTNTPEDAARERGVRGSLMSPKSEQLARMAEAAWRAETCAWRSPEAMPLADVERAHAAAGRAATCAGKLVCARRHVDSRHALLAARTEPREVRGDDRKRSPALGCGHLGGIRNARSNGPVQQLEG